MFGRRQRQLEALAEALKTKIDHIPTQFAALLEQQQTLVEQQQTLIEQQQQEHRKLLAAFQELSETINPEIASGRAAIINMRQIYELLLQSGAVKPPFPKLEALEPGANILIYLDPDLECEILITNPMHPEMYAARLILPIGFARLSERMRKLPNGVWRIGIHIDARKVPENLLKAFFQLFDPNLQKLFPTWLVSRKRDGNTMQTQQWQYAGTMHRPGDPETGAFPHDYIWYFDREITYETMYPVDEDDIISIDVTETTLHGDG